MARELKIKGANATDEEFNALAYEVDWVEKEKKRK